eukprot:996430-Pelagomonas_calceolata.AAC.1
MTVHGECQKARRHEKQVGGAGGDSQDLAQMRTTATLREPQAPALFKYKDYKGYKGCWHTAQESG